MLPYIELAQTNRYEVCLLNPNDNVDENGNEIQVCYNKLAHLNTVIAYE